MGDWMFKHVRLGDANKRLDKELRRGKYKTLTELIVIASQDFGGMLVILLVASVPVYAMYKLLVFLGGLVR